MAANDSRKTQNAGKITHLSPMYENVNETGSLQPSGSKGPHMPLNYNHYFYLI